MFLCMLVGRCSFDSARGQLFTHRSTASRRVLQGNRLTCHEGALTLSELTLHICEALQGIGQLVPLLLQQCIIQPALLLLLLKHM